MLAETAPPVVMPDKMPTLRVVPMPSDANQSGDIFGGWIMSQVDIAGGIAAKNSLCVTHPAFLQELGLVPDIGGIAASVPIYLITDGNSGLWGAACAAAEHLSCRVPRAEKNG